LLELGKKPYFFPVYAGSTPAWKHPSILASYDIIPPTRQKLPFNYEKTLLVVESGGYLETGKPESQKECIEKQMRIMPDLFLTLDIPTKIKGVGRGRDLEERRKKFLMSEPEKKECVDETIRNAKIAMELKETVSELYNHPYEPMAVIQSYDKKSLVYCTEQLYSLGYEFYSFGGIPTDVSARNIPAIESSVYLVRDIVGKGAWLHILGVADLDIIIRIKDAITSFDAASMTWYSTYASLIKPDGSAVRLGERGKITDSKHGHLYPKTTLGYLLLQEKNFENYLEFLHRELWKDKK
jgi:hypothetical protein